MVNDNKVIDSAQRLERDDYLLVKGFFPVEEVICRLLKYLPVMSTA